MPGSVVLVPALRSGYVSVFVEVLELSDTAQRTLGDLLAFCEVVSRTALVHELQITPFSLGTAIARGLTPEQVLATLKKYLRSNKSTSHQQHRHHHHHGDEDDGEENWSIVSGFVHRCMNSFTRARLVIRSGGEAVVECCRSAIIVNASSSASTVMTASAIDDVNREADEEAFCCN